MSNLPETSLDLEDLELQFLPAWAKQSPDANRYAGFKGGGDDASARRSDRPERRGPRLDRERPREGAFGERRQARPGRGDPPRREGDRRGGNFRREERPEPAPPLPEVSVSFLPEEKGVESIARQIKLTGRAYPIFDIARLILRKPERYHATFNTVKKPDGQIAQPLWTCNLDDTLWLSEQESVDHVLRKHFDTFYLAEKAATEPPKGTYTFVAQCGLTGEVLGPPNLHEVQAKMRKLHAERFARMPFDVYKSKVRIVKDEAAVKKWIEGQSWKIEYHCLNISEPKTLASREEVEKHFREVHQANIIRAVDSHTLSGRAAQELPSQPLRWLLRKVWDEQSHFPLRLVTFLSQQFALHGLQFFKVNKTVTHVAVARPHFLDVQATPVSNGITRIVEFINATPNCTRKKLLEGLAPATTSVAGLTAAPAAPTEPTGPADEPRPAVAGSVVAETVAQAGATGKPEPTPEQTAIIADLHWLIHQGHVLEFANGKLETAKKPLPRPLPIPLKQPAKPPESTANLASAPACDKAEIAEATTESVAQPTQSEALPIASGPLEAGTAVEGPGAPGPEAPPALPETQPIEAPGEHA